MRTALAILLIDTLLTCSAVAQTEVVLGYGEFIGDQLGHSVAIEGDIAIVGIYSMDVDLNSGGARLYQWDGIEWADQGLVLSNDLQAHDAFGNAVDIAGDYVVVSAFFEDEIASDAGAVYVFEGLASPIEIAKLVDVTGMGSDFFGNDAAVTVDGDGFPVVLVGASAKEPGSAFVFRWDGIEFQLEATFSSELSASNFGFSVDIDGDRAVVGAPALDSVYVYRWDGLSWTGEDTLSGLNGADFGHAVAISGDLIAVGAPLDSDAGSTAGAVHLFRRQADNTWLQESKVMSSNPSPSDEFGFSVDLWSGIGKDMLFVGAPKGGDVVALNAGAAYRFELEDSVWLEVEEDNPSSASWDDRMGTSIAGTFIPEMNDIVLLAGAPSYNDINLALDNVGAVYSYLSPGITCGDIGRVKTRCTAMGRARGAVLISDPDYVGATVQFLVDGVDTISAVVQSNNIAAFFASGYSAGCPIALIDPPLCPSAMMAGGEFEAEEEESTQSAEATTLHRNYPNPFNPSTRIGYSLVADANVRLVIHNVLGQAVATLVDGFQTPGEKSVLWNGTNDHGQTVASGMYFYRLTVGSTTLTRTMLFEK